jgi:predicted TIM-barrel fold metal-dependent hydrolase
VDSLYSPYRAVVEAYREILRSFSNDEQRRMLTGTAAELYGI